MLTALRATVQATANADVQQMRTRITRTRTRTPACARTSTPARNVMGLYARRHLGPRRHHVQQPAHTARHSGVHPRPPAVQRPQRATRCRRALVAAVAPQPHLPHTHTHRPQRTNAGTRFDKGHQRHVRAEGAMHTRWWQRWRNSTAMGTPAKHIITRDGSGWREQTCRARSV
jgi:hypothetical protein